MTVDGSLKRKGRLSRSRNVLTRDERIAKMMDRDKFADGDSPFGLPKTRVFKAAVGKKKKKETKEEDDDKGKKKKK